MALLVFAGGLYTWAIWQFFTEPVRGGNDFVARITAFEYYFKHGVSPYSDEAAVYTQMHFYGHPSVEGMDEDRLTYPLYSVLIFGPFVFVGDYELARAIFLTLSQAALLGGVALILQLLGWKPRGWMLAGLLLWTVLEYHQARGLILGQFAVLGFFSLALTLFFLDRRRDAWAGAALTITTIKPTLVFLVIPYLLLWAIARRRWRFIYGFVGVMALLFAGSFIVLPTWLGEWLARVWGYTGYTVGQSPVWLLTHQAFPVLGTPWEVGLSLLLVAALMALWWLALRPGGERWFYWTLGITLVVSNLIVPRSATTNYVMMLVTILWIFAALDRNAKWGRPAILLIWLTSLVGMWWLHFVTVEGNQEHAVMYLPLVLVLGMVLVFGARWLEQDTRQRKLFL
jgi:hypothetical protein